METTFASRVRMFREYKGLAQAAFAERCGLTQGNVSQMEAGTEPKQGNVTKLLSGYPDLNPEWLLLGSGSMLRDGVSLTPVPKPVAEAPTPMGPVLVPESDYVKELKERARRAEEQADIWRDLYLGRYTLAEAEASGKVESDNQAAGMSAIGFGYGKAAKGDVKVLGNLVPMMIEGRAYYQCINTGKLVAFEGVARPVVAQEPKLKVAS